MNKETLSKICKKHNLEINMDVGAYGKTVNVFLDDVKLSNDDKENSLLIDWSYDVFHNKIIDFEILDSFSCKVTYHENNLLFRFEFDNSWKYEGLYECEKISPYDLLPYMPDFIMDFEEFSGLDLDEENIFCSFTYDHNYDNKFCIKIHNLWDESNDHISFTSNNYLVEGLKKEIHNRILDNFTDYDRLWVCTEDGTYISILSTYKQSFSYEELF